MTRTVHIIRSLTASLLLAAAVLTLLDPEELRRALAAVDVPRGAAQLVAAAELAVAALLAYPPALRWGAWSSTLLFSGFAGFVAWGMAHGLDTCGCFPGLAVARPGIPLLALDLAGVGGSLFLLSRTERGGAHARH